MSSKGRVPKRLKMNDGAHGGINGAPLGEHSQVAKELDVLDVEGFFFRSLFQARERTQSGRIPERAYSSTVSCILV